MSLNLARDAALPRARKYCLLKPFWSATTVARKLSSTVRPAVFAIGDCASVKQGKSTWKEAQSKYDSCVRQEDKVTSEREEVGHNADRHAPRVVSGAMYYL